MMYESVAKRVVVGVKAVAVAALYRAALLDWGVNEEAKTDNGADYVSEHIVRLLEALEQPEEVSKVDELAARRDAGSRPARPSSRRRKSG